MEIRQIKRNKPRIAMLISMWFPVHTGQQVYTAKLAKSLAENGYEVDVLTRELEGKNTGDEKELEGIAALRIKKFGFKTQAWNPFMQIGYLIWIFFHLLLHGKKYNLYHAHGATTAAAMKAASWFTRVPTMVTVHGNHIFERSWTLKKIIHRVMFLETKYTQELTIAENFLKATNVNEHIAVVPYGVDVEPFDALPNERHPEQFNVLYVGRLDTQKGVDVLLSAVQKVIESNGFIQSHRDFMLHLVGEGPDREAFKRLVQKLGIEKYVRFHGMLSQDHLAVLYKMCDLYVLPSRTEAFPLSVLEACAARLPILATNTGDLHNIVIENINGHLVEPDDADDLAYYIEYFAGNPYLEKLGEGSYNLVTQEYSWDKSIYKLIRVYESVLTQRALAGVKPHEHFMPWQIPSLYFAARGKNKIYKGKQGLRFCLTANLVQAHVSDDLPQENDEIPVFLDRLSEFCENLDIRSTLFVQQDILTAFADPLKTLFQKKHELGIKIMENDWITAPMRRATVRDLRVLLDEGEFKHVRMLRTPLEPSEQDVEILHEAGFEHLPVSEDPWPHVELHWGIPFGHILKMNLETFIELTDTELLESIDRLRAYEKDNGVYPFLIFECNSYEFSSREDLTYASGENFSLLSRKLALLKEHMDLEFMTLSEFCKSCTVSPQSDK